MTVLTRTNADLTSTHGPVVVLHCGDLDGARLERRLRSVLATLPEEARLIATVLRRPSGKIPSLRRARAVVIKDGGMSLLEDAVVNDDLLIVVPMNAHLAPGWFEDVSARAAAQPEKVGVLPVGDNHLFAFPGPVRSMDVSRTGWSSVRGVSRRATHSPVAHRSLGAVMIVKNEEDVIAQCLEALLPLVDEVVVYDTGSSDSTRNIVVASGATLVEGFWDDDFAAARNRALNHSTTDWVLSVDADEVIQAEPRDLREWVDAADGTVAMVDIISTVWDGSEEGYRSRSVRIFQNKINEWRGALHEQVWSSTGEVPLPCSTLPPIKLKHSGYQAATAISKQKRERNISISRAALARLDEDDARWGDACVDYGRSLALAGQYGDTVEVLRKVIDRPVTPGQFVQASRTLIPLLLALGELDVATTWIERADREGEAAGQIAVWRSELFASRGELGLAMAAIHPFTDPARSGGADVWGQAFSVESAHFACAKIEIASGHPGAAYYRLLPLLQAAPDTIPLALVLQASTGAGFAFEDVIEQSPQRFVQRTVREIFTVCPDLALAWLAACRIVSPDDAAIVVAGSIAASRTGVPESLDWSLHARERGIDICALRLAAQDEEVPVSARLSALALLFHGFLDGSARAPLAALDSAADEEARSTALAVLQSIVPTATDLL